ncbi:MAG: phosphoribosylamine--glycine ligase [Sphingomonadaceae bacterium]|nr:phosphoribosylamine--glycine ligase [Sphingomonadaceae bacterium]
MRVLLLGGGGREHAIAWRLAQSPHLARLFAAPGNPGIAAHATLVPELDILDPDAVARWAQAQGIDLVVPGPEAPLVAGVADAVTARGIAVAGPSRAAARLEASKAFTKELCAEAGIPTARWARFDALAPALAYVRAQGAPIVVKADGLAAGKGVTVAATLAEAEAALARLVAQGLTPVVVEECLAGEEASFFVAAHGTTAVPLLAAQDHKRLGEGDTGPNTGGMGAVAPVTALTPETARRVMECIVRPTLQALAARGVEYRGILFAGLMLTEDGPRLLEWNVRLGDPEAQALMMLLESDLLELLWAVATGGLERMSLGWAPGRAIAVTVAARGYPAAPATGAEIGGLADCGATVFHAGTSLNAGRLVAAGGRVLTVAARAGTLREAAAQAYAAIERISFADAVFRRDIGWRELAREAP